MIAHRLIETVDGIRIKRPVRQIMAVFDAIVFARSGGEHDINRAGRMLRLACDDGLRQSRSGGEAAAGRKSTKGKLNICEDLRIHEL